MDKDVHIHNEILCSHKKETMPFMETWINLEILRLSEVRQRKTNIIYHLYVEGKKKKKNTNELIYKTETKAKT